MIQKTQAERTIIFTKRYAKFTKGFDKLIAKLRVSICKGCMYRILEHSFAIYQGDVHHRIKAGFGSQPTLIIRESLNQIPLVWSPEATCLQNTFTVREAYYKLMRHYSKIHMKTDSFTAISGLMNQYLRDYSMKPDTLPNMHENST